MRIDYETLKTQLNGEYRDIFTRAYHYCVWDWYSFSEISLDILTKTWYNDKKNNVISIIN